MKVVFWGTGPSPKFERIKIGEAKLVSDQVRVTGKEVQNLLRDLKVFDADFQVISMTDAIRYLKALPGNVNGTYVSAEMHTDG